MFVGGCDINGSCSKIMIGVVVLGGMISRHCVRGSNNRSGGYSGGGDRNGIKTNNTSGRSGGGGRGNYGNRRRLIFHPLDQHGVLAFFVCTF